MIVAELLPLAALFSTHVLRWTVWIGLVSITIALGILTRTQWGHAQPLRKCIVLSLLAHLLLGIYATTVEIVTGGIGPGEPSGILNVELSDDSGQPPDNLTETPPSEQAPLWERFVDDRRAFDEPTVAVNRPEPVVAAPPRAPFRSLPDRSPPLAAAPDEPPPRDAAGRGEEAPIVKPQGPALIEAIAASKVDAAPQIASLQNTPQPNAVRLPPKIGSLPAEPLELLEGMSDNAAKVQLTSSVRPPEARAGQHDGQAVRPANLSDRAADNALGAPAQAYSERTADDRAKIAAQHGGNATTEAAVQAALKWISSHQSADGRWRGADLEAGREGNVGGQNRDGAGSSADTGLTGLALLAMLASGNTQQQGEYQSEVGKALEFLTSMQADDGNLGGDAAAFERMYCHGMATFALGEAYGMTKDPALLPPLKRAVAYTIASQHPSTGGWRYHPGELGDTSQLGWQCMALKSAELAGLTVPDHTHAGMVTFLRSVTSGQHHGLASYRPSHRVTRAMTAEALVCRQFLGMARENPASDEAGDFLLQELPGSGEANLYYWYYGTLGMFQLQGRHWDRWNEKMQAKLLSTQRTGGDVSGSWDPDPIWGAYGGRVYSTALAALCLEVYYRYLPLYGGKP